MNTLNGFLSLENFIQYLKVEQELVLAPALQERVNESFNFLKDYAKNKVIYGVNTGFGPMAQYRIKDEECVALQYNLIRSHSSGIGNPLSVEQVRAAILARLNSLSLGYSGINLEVIELMKTLLNKGITPLIFAHGGVGASGDLVQLAHLALVLIGEGEVFYKGERRNTKEVFELENVTPMRISIREGISLMNGTSVMTGIGILNWHKANTLLDWSVKIACAINELVAAYDDHLSAELNEAKLHKGQQHIAQQMRQNLQDSQLIKKREEHLYNGTNQEEIFKDKVQEYYSIRCIPQILGPIYDTIQEVGKVLENEMNSANDNPVIDVKSQQVYHGGNFHGDYISLEMDKLKLVVTRLTMLAERQLNYLLNAKINELLPPFVNLGKLGFNFGMQGAQFTATSTTAECQALATSMYIHSIPNNNDNQDIVSMGTNAAVLCDKLIENSFEVLSIEILTLVQAIDALAYKDKVSETTKKWYAEIRQIIPEFSDDQALYPYLQQIKEYLKA
ncbi:aromatic amino acid lyase [Myroides sp. 1354]|uniref:HAL/PAL/TAL family ammonia-lyase n=1 Tax=unclassified Myroides TaxID=2642485 RepID=UPI002574A0DC|nr:MULTISPECIES: aromatic amino acid ammonia-lyase [unclassified Myroides]MDM1043656.1 aromatic amino acid lyase [Myroides sp. R163-1]MDM1054294.1 aromatic amino acid lyase [Myroides sp. 1354]MDM1067590.1 aromatic amino acid lyase [Myroides sp. 1372]